MNQPPILQFNLDSIREIAQLLRESELGEICLETTSEDTPATRLCLRRAAPAPAPAPMAAAPVSPLPVAAQSTPSAPATAAELSLLEELSPAPKAIEVKSLSVGVFREAKVRLQVGDEIKARQVLGVVESLRVPNEIAAPAAGRILEISTSEGQGVEYGQVLFVIEETE